MKNPERWDTNSNSFFITLDHLIFQSLFFPHDYVILESLQMLETSHFFFSSSSICRRKYLAFFLPFPRVQLPYSQSGITIAKNSIYVKVASKSGIVLMWNEDDSILVRTAPGPVYNFREQSQSLIRPVPVSLWGYYCHPITYC